MSYKILEANGVDNENVDGAELNCYLSGGADGIIAGVLEECVVTSSGSVLGVSPGLLILCGIRVKITEMELIEMDSMPAEDTQYQLIAQVSLGDNRDVSFSLFVQPPTLLKRGNLYKSERGTYQIELATFTHKADGSIASLKNTAAICFAPFYSRGETDALLASRFAECEQARKELSDRIEARAGENLALIEKNAEHISENAKKIDSLTNVLLAEGEIVKVEVEQSYSTRQTADGEAVIDGSLSFVKEIKGNTVKSENLCPYPYNVNSYNESGVKWTVNSDGSITANGTATGNSIFVIHRASNFILPAGTYMFSGANGGSQSTYNIQVGVTPVSGGEPAYYNATKGTKVTLSEPCNVLIQAVVYSGYNASRLTFYPMINEGTVVKPYTPYFSDLKSASISSIKSTGRNLFYAESAIKGKGLSVSTGDLYDADNYFTSDYIPVTASTVYSINWETKKWSGCYDENKRFLGQSTDTATSITTLANTAYIRFTADLSELNTIMLNFGATALPFEPYIEDTYQLPQTIELGLGDTFNPQTGEVTRATETITLDGSKAWITNREDGTVSGWYAKPEHWKVYNTTLCDDNDFVSSKPINANTANYNFYKLFPSGTTLEEVQAYFNGIVVAGKLKTPTTETIENAPQFYTAWRGGSERIVQGKTDNSKYGAMPTITQEYFIPTGGATDEQSE